MYFFQIKICIFLKAINNIQRNDEHQDTIYKPMFMSSDILYTKKTVSVVVQFAFVLLHAKTADTISEQNLEVNDRCDLLYSCHFSSDSGSTELAYRQVKRFLRK